MSDLLRHGTFEQGDLELVPPFKKPVILKSGGPIMELLGQTRHNAKLNCEEVLCEWDDGRGWFVPATLYRLIPFQQEQE